MKNTKQLIIYLIACVAVILLMSSFDAQFYFAYAKTANISPEYMYKVFTDDTASLPTVPESQSGDETRKDSYEFGDSSKFILPYKRILYYMGYMEYPTSDVFDQPFSDALTAYQRAKEVNPSGVLSASMMGMLDQEELEFTEGMRGEEILAYQQTLQALGFIPDGEGLNGNFGDVTSFAVKNYQIERGLEATGTINVQTQEELEEDRIKLDAIDNGTTDNAPKDTGSEQEN